MCPREGWICEIVSYQLKFELKPKYELSNFTTLVKKYKRVAKILKLVGNQCDNL